MCVLKQVNEEHDKFHLTTNVSVTGSQRTNFLKKKN